MSAREEFSVERFESLAGGTLERYVEPFLASQPEPLPPRSEETLAAHLAGMDEEHLVYALEIGMRHRPDLFIPHAIAFLAHSEAAVCSTAYRVIMNLSPESLPADLGPQLLGVLRVNLTTTDVRSGERIPCGSNWVFLHDLRTKFLPASTEVA